MKESPEPKKDVKAGFFSHTRKISLFSAHKAAPVVPKCEITAENAWDMREYEVRMPHGRTVGVAAQMHRMKKHVMKISQEFITVSSSHNDGMSSSAMASAGSYFSDMQSEQGKKPAEESPAESRRRIIKAPIHMDSVTSAGRIAGKKNWFFIMIDTEEYDFESSACDDILTQLSFILRDREISAALAGTNDGIADFGG